MKTIVRRKVVKHNKLFEDDVQQQQQPQQQQQQQQPIQNNAQQQQPANNPQQNNNIDINTCITNVNNFIGNLYAQMQQQVKNNLEKSCPELLAIFKDTQSPYAAEAKKVSDAFGAFTKVEIKPDDVQTVENGIKNFANFIQVLSGFNVEAEKIAENSQSANNQNSQQQDQNTQVQQQPAQNNVQQQPQDQNIQQQQQPATQPTQENYNINGFGQLLYENLHKQRLMNHLESYNNF